MAAASIFPVQSLPDGRIRYSDGSIKNPQSSATDSNAANYRPAMSQAVYQQPYTGGSVRSDGDVLGTSTTDSSNVDLSNPAKKTDYARSKGFDSWDQYENSQRNNAQSGYNSSLQAIQNRLNEVRNSARSKINQAASDRDYILNTLSTRYPELINRVNQQRESSLGELDTQEKKLQYIYDKANAQARRRSESAALQNRMIARAGNRLGSSFYDETVAQNRENLNSTLGESDMERADKIGAVGTQRTETNQFFDNTVNDLEFQRKTAEDQAVREYQKNVADAEALERAGVLDFGEGEAQARSVLDSRLGQIDAFVQNLAMRRQELDASLGRSTSALDTYGFSDPYNTTMADEDALVATNTMKPVVMGNTGGGTANQIATLLGLSRRPEDEIVPNQGITGLDRLRALSGRNSIPALAFA